MHTLVACFILELTLFFWVLKIIVWNKRFERHTENTVCESSNITAILKVDIVKEHILNSLSYQEKAMLQ